MAVGGDRSGRAAEAYDPLRQEWVPRGRAHLPLFKSYLLICSVVKWNTE